MLQRDKRCFRTGSVAAFYSIIQQVEKYTAQFRRGNIGFLRKKNLVGNFDIFLHGKKSFVRKDGVDQAVLADGMETFSLKIIGDGWQVVLDLIIFVGFQVILKCL